MSANLGDPPAQDTACALAENVWLGITTRPRAPSDCSTSIKPAVQDETATTCRTSSRSASEASSSRTVGPLVRCARAEHVLEPDGSGPGCRRR